jgi:hypothetical protein
VKMASFPFTYSILCKRLFTFAEYVQCDRGVSLCLHVSATTRKQTTITNLKNRDSVSGFRVPCPPCRISVSLCVLTSPEAKGRFRGTIGIRWRSATVGDSIFALGRHSGDDDAIETSRGCEARCRGAPRDVRLIRERSEVAI